LSTTQRKHLCHSFCCHAKQTLQRTQSHAQTGRGCISATAASSRPWLCAFPVQASELIERARQGGRTLWNIQSATRPPTPTTASFAAGRGTDAGISDAAEVASLSPDRTTPATYMSATAVCARRRRASQPGPMPRLTCGAHLTVCQQRDTLTPHVFTAHCPCMPLPGTFPPSHMQHKVSPTHICLQDHRQFVIASVGKDNVSSALRSESPTPSSSARTVTQLLRRLAALCCVRHTRCGACLLSALRSLQQQVKVEGLFFFA